MDEGRIVKYYASKNPNIALKVIKGHFATTHSHVSHYLDMTTMKTRQREAEQIAVAMKDYYNVMGKPIDTIVCMDGCEVIGAFLASELTKAGVLSMNAHKTIYVISPEYDSNGLMIFRDNLKHEIKNRNVLLLLASASTGTTVKNVFPTMVEFFRVYLLYSVPLITLTVTTSILCLRQMIFRDTTFTLTMIALCARQMRKLKPSLMDMGIVNYNVIFALKVRLLYEI